MQHKWLMHVLRRPVLGLANQDECAESHASLTGSTESGTRDGVQSVVLVAVGQHSGVVLCAQIGLTAFPVLTRSLVDVLTRLVAANKAHSFDERLVENEIYSLGGPVDDIDDTRWKASLLSQLCQNHRCTRVSL